MAHKYLDNHRWYTIGSMVDILLKPEFVDHGQGIIDIHPKIDRTLIISRITE